MNENENTADVEYVPEVTERNWQWAEWKPSDATVHYPDGRIEVEPGGWNHDDCLECHACICEEHLRFAYKDDNSDWLCPVCYERLIVPMQTDTREGS